MSYPNPPQNAGQYMAPPPPKKKKWIKWVVIAAVVALIFWGIGSCFSSVATNLANTPPDTVVTEGEEPPAPVEEAPEEKKEAAPYKVKATECKRRPGEYSMGMIDIKVKITNNSDKKMTYFFDIAVEDTEGNIVGSGAGSVDNVRAGKSGTASVFASMQDEEYEGKIKCIIEVTDLQDF